MNETCINWRVGFKTTRECKLSNMSDQSDYISQGKKFPAVPWQAHLCMTFGSQNRESSGTSSIPWNPMPVIPLSAFLVRAKNVSGTCIQGRYDRNQSRLIGSFREPLVDEPKERRCCFSERARRALTRFNRSCTFSACIFKR